MLRAALIIASGLGLLAAIVTSWMDGVIYWEPVIALAALFVFTIFERYRYQRLLDVSPGPGWQVTNERFVDPSSGKTVTVYFNPATGKRRYVSKPDNL